MHKIRLFLPILITLCIIILFCIKRFVFLKFYPPICNFIVFIIFSSSLFHKETIIQIFARKFGDKLEKPAWLYTRKLTYIWCIFMFVNLLISVWTIFLPDKIWIIYNGCISYILIGLIFIIEYIVRIILRKRKLIWCWKFLLQVNMTTK